MSCRSINSLLKEHFQTIASYCKYVLWLRKSQKAAFKIKSKCLSVPQSLYCKLGMTEMFTKWFTCISVVGEKYNLNLLQFPNSNLFILMLKICLIFYLAHQLRSNTYTKYKIEKEKILNVIYLHLTLFLKFSFTWETISPKQNIPYHLLCLLNSY